LREVRAARELHLNWISPTGEYIIANLGNTIDQFELRKAITTRAPEG